MEGRRDILAGPIAEPEWRKCSRAAIGQIGDDMADECLDDPAPLPERPRAGPNTIGVGEPG